MELKYRKHLFVKLKACCFNRTFMELKFDLGDIVQACFDVLIVPLWN